MSNQSTGSTINIPNLPFKQTSVTDNNLQNNTFDFEEVAGPKFVEFLSRNQISALSCTGNIQHPDSLLCIDIPYFWCNYCSYKTIQKSEILDHIQCHKFTCQFCEFSAFTRCEVLKHSMSKHLHNTNFRLFWFCVLNCDQILVEHNNGEQTKATGRQEATSEPETATRLEATTRPEATTRRKATRARSKRLREPETEQQASSKSWQEPESKQPDVVLLKKIKLEKPDGEFLETSVEVPNSKQNLPLDPTDLSDDVDQRMQHLRNALSEISDEMNGVSGYADPVGSELPRVSKQPIDSTESTKSQSSYLRSILTTTDNFIPTDEPTERNGLGIENNRPIATETLPVEPVVKIEVIDDPFVDQQVSYPKVIEDKTATTVLRKNDSSRPKSSTPDPTNLPILRTMLQCPELLSSSTASSVSGEGSQDSTTTTNKPDSVDSRLSEDSEYDSGDNDNDDDDDYLPTKNDSSGDEWSYTPKSTGKKGKKGKKMSVYSCPNCSACKSTFKPTKNHLFRVHPSANLVLREDFSNSFVFVCPSFNCTFRVSEFTAFVRHLENCDVFSLRQFTDIDGFNMMNTLLVTFRNILERSKSHWLYACSLCAMKFKHLSSALSHAHRRNLECPLSDCLFKLRNKAVVMYCKNCKAEVSVSNWTVLLNKNCKQHQFSDANLTLNVSSPSTSTSTPISTSQPPAKVDSTPQLRAMLQRRTEQDADADTDRTRGASPDTENLPASRMLQWLITEGSRMMHMLK